MPILVPILVPVSQTSSVETLCGCGLNTAGDFVVMFYSMVFRPPCLRGLICRFDNFPQTAGFLQELSCRLQSGGIEAADWPRQCDVTVTQGERGCMRGP